MRFDVVTIFPELFAAHLTHGVTRRAFESRQVDVRLWPLRDHADNAYRRVDDRPYGGGPGMVMMIQPLERALIAIRDDRKAALGNADDDAAPVIHFTPTGRTLDQAIVREFAARSGTGSGGILLCGRYEGIDQRFIDRRVDIELSLGDFVLSGGELPALALLDAIARLQDGVLGDAQSHIQDSFSDGLLDCPHFSRPETLASNEGASTVPPVLMSGNHAEIARWRRQQSLRLTSERRPDLIARARVDGLLTRQDEQYLAGLASAAL